MLCVWRGYTRYVCQWLISGILVSVLLTSVMMAFFKLFCYDGMLVSVGLTDWSSVSWKFQCCCWATCQVSKWYFNSQCQGFPDITILFLLFPTEWNHAVGSALWTEAWRMWTVGIMHLSYVFLALTLPTNTISIEFEIRPNFDVLWFTMHSTDHH